MFTPSSTTSLQTLSITVSTTQNLIIYIDENEYTNIYVLGFKKPLMACCGDGGPPYNYNPKIRCLVVAGFSVCKKGSLHISWDGIHFTEAANRIVASQILSTNYSTPPLQFNFFCN